MDGCVIQIRVIQIQPCKIWRKLCQYKLTSIKELNMHHKTDHGIENCDKCDKSFTTRSALEKQMYLHRELKCVCDICGKGFPFKSWLDQHKLVHYPESRLSCVNKTCGKKFKNPGDYNRHFKTHDKGSWYHCSQWSYKNKDKQNRDSHMRVHTPEGEEERNECPHCHKKLQFSTQVKRH